MRRVIRIILGIIILWLGMDGYEAFIALHSILIAHPEGFAKGLVWMIGLPIIIYTTW